MVKSMVGNFERIEQDLMHVELPQIDEEASEELQAQVDEIKDFRDQIYLQIKTSTEIAQKDLEATVSSSAKKSMKPAKKFGNTLKSSLIQYLEKENKQNAPAEEPEDTEDIQLWASANTMALMKSIV